MNTQLEKHLIISPNAIELLAHGEKITKGNFHKIEGIDRNSFPSISDVVNEMKSETGISVHLDQKQQFDDAWHESFDNIFKSAGPEFEKELKDYKTLGTSNGYPLGLQMMILPPGRYFKIHAHPNIEFECTLLGTLCEFRWLFKHSVEEINARNKDNLKGPTIPQNSNFEYNNVTQGQCMLNEAGSVHQSFTGKDKGCVILVLWSGCHAETHPSRVFNKDERLMPSAGW